MRSGSYSREPAGVFNPCTPTRISLLRQRNAGQRKAPMRTVALGANCDGGAWAHTDTSPHLTATGRTTKAPGVPVVPGSEDHGRQATKNRPPISFISRQTARWGSVHRRKPEMVCGGLVGRYSGQLSGQVFAVPEGVWEPCEPAVQSRPARGRLRALAPFFAPRFFGKTKKCGSGAGVKPLRAATSTQRS